MSAAARVRSRRRSGVALIAAGLVCASATMFTWRIGSPARADATLGSFDLLAGARGWRFFDEDATNGNQEAEVPESSADLTTGPVGYGLSSLAWPGPLAANAGTLILVLQPTAPPQTTMLNDPVRAEAHTGQNPPTTTYRGAPGTLMTATAKPDLVEALATVDSSAGAGTFGPSRTHAITTLEGASGKATSDSLVQNISLAAGAVKIDSVSSTATATTDGTTSNGDAHTVVNGMTVGGQPATIDDKGLHIGSQNQPANAIANQIAQQALSQSGTTITLSQPSKEIKGATSTATAGSLVVSWNTGSGSVFSVTIGGAMASVTAAPGTDSALTDLALPAGDTGSGSLPATDAGAASLPSGSSVSGATAGAAPSATSGATPAGTATKRPALKLTGYGKVIKPGSVVLGVVAAALMALGMRRLSDQILAEPVAAPCPLAEGD